MTASTIINCKLLNSKPIENGLYLNWTETVVEICFNIILMTVTCSVGSGILKYYVQGVSKNLLETLETLLELAVFRLQQWLPSECHVRDNNVAFFNHRSGFFRVPSVHHIFGSISTTQSWRHTRTQYMSGKPWRTCDRDSFFLAGSPVLHSLNKERQHVIIVSVSRRARNLHVFFLNLIYGATISVGSFLHIIQHIWG